MTAVWGVAGALLAFALAGACSDALGPDASELAAARARWERSGTTSYEYRLQRACFCGLEFLRPVRVTVEAGAVVAAVFADTGEPVRTPLSDVETIDDLFDEIQDAIDREAFRIDATYDPDLGFPVDVAIDFEEWTIDEEMAFSVRSFTRP